jgi:hypothetical protein
MNEEVTVDEEISNSLSLITTLGCDLSDSEREELIKKAYISSLAVKDFVRGDLDINSFLDVQEYCLTETSMDSYLNTVADNIENLPFAELLIG